MRFNGGSIVTTLNSTNQLDKFGLASGGGSPLHRAGKKSPDPHHHTDGWVPIRDLHARHRHRILDHLLHLDERDRYLRFGSTTPAAQLSKYVASIDFKRDEVFGIFNRKLQLVAMAHLAAMPDKNPGEGKPTIRAVEFGVSVLPSGRGLGLGMRLFQHAITHARNQGASHLMIHALTENSAMLHIAAKAGALIEQDGPDTEAWLKLPADTVGSHLDSSLHSLAAELIYRVQYRVIHISDWLRLLISSP